MLRKMIESNGHYLLRVASDGYKRPDNKIVRTVRDVILEVDGDGNVVDDFRLFEILDRTATTCSKRLTRVRCA